MKRRRSGGKLLRSGVSVLVLGGLGLIGSTPESGAVSAPTPPSVLHVDLSQPLVGCDPVGEQIPASTQQVLSLVLPSAYETTPRGVIQQASSFLVQAEVHSLNPLVVVYTIRGDARWSDGQPISAADFIATWHDGATGFGPAMAQYRLIRSIVATPATHDVVVTFMRPVSSWQALFSPLLPSQVSAAAFKSCASPSPAVDLSAGPYSLVQGSTSGVTLARNPSWWGTVPEFDPVTVAGGIPLVIAPGNGGVALSQASWLSPTTLAGITSAPAASSTLGLSNRLLSLDFSMRGPFRLPLDVRQGIAGLLDRAALVSSTADGIYPSVKPATSHLFSQGLPDYPMPSDVPPIDSATTTTSTIAPVTAESTPSTTVPTTVTTSPFSEAIRSLRRAGLDYRGGGWLSASGRPLRFTMAVPTDDQWALDVAGAIVQQLGAQGISLQLVPVAGSFEVAQDLQSGRTQLGIMVRTTDAFASDSAAWFTVTKGIPASPMWAGFSDKTLNALALAQSREMNAQTALTQYRAMDARLWAIMPSLPLLTEPAVLAWSSMIDGITLNAYPPGTLAAIGTWKLLVASP